MSTEHLLGDISVILDALIGIDNAVRKDAEARLIDLAVQSTAPFLLLLAQVGALGVGGFQVDQRLLALILLRRVAFREQLRLALNPADPHPAAPLDVIPQNVQERIEKVLATGLEDEMDTRIRKGLGVCVGEWVTECKRRQRPFQSLPAVLVKLTESPRPFHRFSPFQIIDAVPGILTEESLMGQSVPGDRIAALLLGGMHDPSVDVRIEALKATRGILDEGMLTRDRKMFGPQLVETAVRILPGIPLDMLEQALIPLIDIASSFPELFRTSLTIVVPFLISCVAPPNTLAGISFSQYPHLDMEFTSWCDMANVAFEVLYSLAIGDAILAAQWEGGQLIAQIVSALIGRQIAEFAADGDSCQDWLVAVDDEDDDEDYPVYAEQMLNRLAQIFKNNNVIVAVAQQASLLMPRTEWRSKYCSLMALASVSEGCYEVMEQESQYLLELIAPAARDPHPRVRYGFLYCLSQLCTNLEGTIQQQYGAQVLDVVYELLEDETARVRNAAAAVLVNFFDVDEEDVGALPEVEDARMRPLLTKIMTRLQAEETLAVLEQLYPAISAIATYMKHNFIPFYPAVMAWCLSQLASLGLQTDRAKTLMGYSMRTASLIGEAVGKEAFLKDAITLCSTLLQVQNNLASEDDKLWEFVADAWRVLATTMGRDMAPFLQYIIPRVLKAASYVPPATAKSIMDDPDADGDEYDQSNSSEMQAKEEAFTQLAHYVYIMGDAYAPWIVETMDVAMTALRFQWSDGVRESACYLVPGLLQAAKDANVWVGDAANLETLFRTLINAIPHEHEVDRVAQLYQSLDDCLRVLGTPLPAANASHLARVTLDWLQAIYERRQERAVEGGGEGRAERTDYWIWVDTEKQEEAAENEAVAGMTRALDRVVKTNPASLGNMGQVAQALNKIHAAACFPPEDEE